MSQSLLLEEISQNNYSSMNEIALIYKKLPKKGLRLKLEIS